MMPLMIPDYIKAAIETHAEEFIKRANGKGFLQWTKKDAFSWWKHFFHANGWNYYCAYLETTNGPLNDEVVS